jgi:8-oxo-dGTP pyrophosphatase MutT (NUDIX family)
MPDAVNVRLAATVILARDAGDSMELFMVVRHHQIDFASGALVFPGGSATTSDRDPRIRGLSDGAVGLNEDTLAANVAAIRESFEECGVLYARPNGSDDLVDGARAEALGAKYRADLEADKIGMADIAEAEGLRIAVDRMVHFAHWITPPHMPKRFDTHFFIAEAPMDHVLAHDGHENVDSVWITPVQACEDADAGTRTVIFPTRLNIEKVGQSNNVGAAIARARKSPVVTVLPESEKVEGGRIMRIPEAAGYGAAELFVEGGSGKAARIRYPDGTERSTSIAMKPIDD